MCPIDERLKLLEIAWGLTPQERVVHQMHLRKFPVGHAFRPCNHPKDMEKGGGGVCCSTCALAQLEWLPLEQTLGRYLALLLSTELLCREKLSPRGREIAIQMNESLLKLIGEWCGRLIDVSTERDRRMS